MCFYDQKNFWFQQSVGCSFCSTQYLKPASVLPKCTDLESGPHQEAQTFPNLEMKQKRIESSNSGREVLQRELLLFKVSGVAKRDSPCKLQVNHAGEFP